jgi:hypothetical protein
VLSKKSRTAIALGVLLFSGGISHDLEASPDTACFNQAPHSSVRHSSTEYYEFELVTTRNVPGTGRSSGLGQVTFTRSPFVVSIGEDGSYQYDLTITGLNLKPPREGVFVAWAMTPEIDQVVRLGVMDENLAVTGTVRWNKFLVAITLEEHDEPSAAQWSGPIVMRGVSRSGLMHTLAGHGPFQAELCATYGFGN